MRRCARKIAENFSTTNKLLALCGFRSTTTDVARRSASVHTSRCDLYSIIYHSIISHSLIHMPPPTFWPHHSPRVRCWMFSWADKNVTRPHRKEYGRLSLDEDSAASSTSNDGSNNGTSCCAGFDETRLKCSGSGGNGLGADAAASGPSAFVCDGYNNHHQHDHNTHSSYCETTPTSHGAPTAHGLSASTSMMSTTTTATENSQHGSSMDGCSSSSTNGGAGGGSVGISCCIGCNCGEHVATDGLHGADNNANGCMSAAVHGDPRLQAMATSDDDEFGESGALALCWWKVGLVGHLSVADHQRAQRVFLVCVGQCSRVRAHIILCVLSCTI